ncbi:AtaL-like protein [Rivihabitans pingtungensis]|uniref:AtaL-like protein n=1 Tax=Rivihabitans pingtungensis TaxID=1054498 RepID=UPI00289E5B2E|nr:AtaL-like protein [Rivihabitans pingtungensis]
MYFEHVIQVNDLNNPMATTLSRQVLWRGLVRRAERPQDFLPDLAHGDIIARGEDWFDRIVRLGTLHVRDRVTLQAEHSLRHDTAAGDGYPASTLTISIEEPEPLSLFVRFVYQSTLPEHTPPGSEVDYVAYLKSAYQQMDTEAIATLRQLAEAGELD